MKNRKLLGSFLTECRQSHPCKMDSDASQKLSVVWPTTFQRRSNIHLSWWKLEICSRPKSQWPRSKMWQMKFSDLQMQNLNSPCKSWTLLEFDMKFGSVPHLVWKWFQHRHSQILKKLQKSSDRPWYSPPIWPQFEKMKSFSVMNRCCQEIECLL